MDDVEGDPPSIRDWYPPRSGRPSADLMNMDAMLRECLQRKRQAERGEDLDIFLRVAEDAGVWSRSRETHINTECFSERVCSCLGEHL